jgi:hypothetical protein
MAELPPSAAGFSSGNKYNVTKVPRRALLLNLKIVGYCNAGVDDLPRSEAHSEEMRKYLQRIQYRRKPCVQKRHRLHHSPCQREFPVIEISIQI